MVLIGYAHCVQHDLTQAKIIAPEYADSGDPALLAAHCLEAVDPALSERVQEGDILVLNGTLAADEAAVIALQALGIAGVVCAAAAEPLRELAGSYGLPVLVQPAAAAAIDQGAVLRLDLNRGSIEVRGGTRWQTSACSDQIIAAVRRAQLLVRMRRVVEDEGYAE